jgi:hypothetical protein
MRDDAITMCLDDRNLRVLKHRAIKGVEGNRGKRCWFQENTDVAKLFSNHIDPNFPLPHCPLSDVSSLVTHAFSLFEENRSELQAMSVRITRLIAAPFHLPPPTTSGSDNAEAIGTDRSVSCRNFRILIKMTKATRLQGVEKLKVGGAD